jgi:hypothetical protein
LQLIAATHSLDTSIKIPARKIYFNGGLTLQRSNLKTQPEVIFPFVLVFRRLPFARCLGQRRCDPSIARKKRRITRRKTSAVRASVWLQGCALEIGWNYGSRGNSAWVPRSVVGRLVKSMRERMYIQVTGACGSFELWRKLTPFLLTYR